MSVPADNFAGSGTMSRQRKGSIKGNNPMGTLGMGKGKKGKRIAMPGAPMPTKPPRKTSANTSETSDYRFSTLPPLPGN